MLTDRLVDLISEEMFKILPSAKFGEFKAKLSAVTSKRILTFLPKIDTLQK